MIYYGLLLVDIDRDLHLSLFMTLLVSASAQYLYLL